MPDSNHVLVVDDSATQREQLRMLLHSEGYEVVVASDGNEALRLVAAKQPSVVLTDLQMPGMDGLELVERLRAQSLAVPVVLTTSQGSEEIAAKALQAGAASYVPKRDLQNSLAPTIRRVISLVQKERQQQTIARFAVESCVELSLINDDSLVPSVIARLEQPIIELGTFDEGERMQIAMALDEALVNAMIHGNLEVSSELRDLDEGQQYVDLIEKRKQQTPYRDRRVSVRLQADAKEAVFVIRDEGCGFDLSTLRDPTDPENLDKTGGRGLLLINAFMDEVRHNQMGNEIVMVKRKSAPSTDS